MDLKHNTATRASYGTNVTRRPYLMSVENEMDPGEHSGPPARAHTGRGDDHRPVSRADDGPSLPWPPIPLLGALREFHAEHGQDG